jgi:uncharacterized membrane protein
MNFRIKRQRKGQTMLTTVVLLLACALLAAAGVPLILKLIPPNPIYGVRTERALSRSEIWYEVNRFGGWALVIAAGVAALLLMLWSGTMLKPAWRQMLAVLLPVAIAVGVTLWYERQIPTRRRSPKGEES